MDRSRAPVETWERRHGAALAPLARYRRREPERTLLHEVVRDRLEPFLAAAREWSPSGRGLPAHVERDLRAYLDCGLLCRGFARTRCSGCGFERLVAFSCKARSCPSCNARRMEDAADHLVHDVFPAVPVRQWVLSFPRGLRFRAARDPAVAGRLLDLFTRAVFAWQRRRGRLLGVADPRTASCTAVKRFGSAINLNVHFHTLIPDGVFDLSGDGPARFVPLRPPTEEDVAGILARVIKRVIRKLPLPEEDAADAEVDDFAALQAAEVDRRLRFPDSFKHARCAASLDGFSLHAGVRIHANDREGLVRLCRYALRPPFALHRLSRGPEGRLVYRMKRPRGGSLLLVLTPDELLARIATLVPPPRLPPPGRPTPRYRIPWAELLQRVFAVDVLECPRCAGRLELVAFINEPAVARKILDHLGLASQAPPLARAGAPGEDLAFDPGPDYAVADPCPED